MSTIPAVEEARRYVALPTVDADSKRIIRNLLAQANPAAIVDCLDATLLAQLTLTIGALKQIAASGSDFTSGDGHAYAIRLAKDAIAKTQNQL